MSIDPTLLLANASAAGLVFSLPLKDPVLIFSLMLFIILMMPILAARLKVPGIILLILAGLLVGPHGLNLLKREGGIVLFGTVGLLYIMFLAGLELDLNAFKKRRLRSLTFGALTFFLPLSIGFPVCYFLLDYDGLASLMIASMFATHTLVAYPIASRLGLTRNEAVAVAVGGTIITDTAVLLLLAVITGASQGTLNLAFWFRLIVSLAVFSGVVFWGFPRVGSWFFRNLQGERTSQFLFVLALVFLAAFMAQLAGVEPIIGAFAAGLALNRLIPHSSALMYQLEFVGNALFIPFFLIGVGMLVDLSVLTRGPEALVVAGALTVVAELGKWLAAASTQLLFRYSNSQRDLIFGLSSAHAAATLAVILIGYDLKILDENVLNGTIVLILVTCLVASFMTEHAGRKLALEVNSSPPKPSEIPEKILVPIANPHTMEKLLDFAVLIKGTDTAEPIYPLVVVQDDEEAQTRMIQSRKTLEQAIQHARSLHTQVNVTTRIDLNVPGGIARMGRELGATAIVLGWSDKVTAFDRLLGTKLDSLLEHTWQMLLVCHFIYPLHTMQRLVVMVPDNAEVEIGFKLWLRKLLRLARAIEAELVLYASDKTHQALRREIDTQTQPINLQPLSDWEDYLELRLDLDDLLVLVSARRGTVSHISGMEGINTRVARHFQQHNFLLLYPEQSPVAELPKFLAEPLEP